MPVYSWQTANTEMLSSFWVQLHRHECLFYPRPRRHNKTRRILIGPKVYGRAEVKMVQRRNRWIQLRYVALFGFSRDDIYILHKIKYFKWLSSRGFVTIFSQQTEVTITPIKECLEFWPHLLDLTGQNTQRWWSFPVDWRLFFSHLYVHVPLSARRICWSWGKKG